MDRIIHAITEDGMLKMAVIEGRGLAEEARRIHGLSPVACAALGRTLCAASLLGEQMKGAEESVTLRVDGGGPLGGVTAVSDSGGRVRGYVGNPRLDLPLRRDGKLDVGGAVGRDGLFTVSRDLALKEPYSGSVPLVSGEIAEDLARYLLASEQIASACALGVLVDTDCTVKAAGGFLAQLMPGAPDTLGAAVSDNVRRMDRLTTILSEDGPEAVFDRVLAGVPFRIENEVPVCYRCACSRGRIGRALTSLPPDEIAELTEEGKEIEVVCEFCRQRHIFTAADLAAFRAENAGEG